MYHFDWLTASRKLRFVHLLETLNQSRFKKMGANPLTAWDQL